MGDELFKRIIRAAIESFPIDFKKKRELRDRLEGKERKGTHEGRK